MSICLLKSRCDCPPFSQCGLYSEILPSFNCEVGAGRSYLYHITSLSFIEYLPQPLSLSSVKICQYALQPATALLYTYLKHGLLGPHFPCVDLANNPRWGRFSQAPQEKHWAKSPIPSSRQRSPSKLST